MPPTSGKDTLGTMVGVYRNSYQLQLPVPLGPSFDGKARSVTPLPGRWRAHEMRKRPFSDLVSVPAVSSRADANANCSFPDPSDAFNT